MEKKDKLKIVTIRKLRQRGSFAVRDLPLRLTRWGRVVGIIISEEEYKEKSKTW